MDDKLPAISDKNFTSGFFAALKDKALRGSAGITGLLSSERRDFILTGGRLFQGIINLEFLDTLKNEWDGYREKGKIKDDHQQTEQHHACLQQILDFIDNDKPDKTRFDFMKKIFLSASFEKIESRDSVLPQQYMFIARQLTSGDILLLKGTFEMHKQGVISVKNRDGQEWLKRAAEYSSLNHVKLVEFHEKHLMELGLITHKYSPRPDHPHMTQITPGDTNRLTDLGLALCEFVRGYEDEAGN